MERRYQGADGELLGWFIVRAFGKIKDVSTLPILRRIAEEGEKQSTQNQKARERTISIELAREARRVIALLEANQNQNPQQLLRPANSPTETLLRPAETPPNELLRPFE